MKRIALFAAVAALLLILAAGFFAWPEIRFVHSLSVQMKTGQKHMDSITESDIPAWTSRTEALLKNYGTQSAGRHSLEDQSVPADLQQLGILRVDIYDSDTVGYLWLGGMDHTYLEIQRANGSNFIFTAHYNDQTSRVIWPKK
jgi:hypothetical protein